MLRILIVHPHRLICSLYASVLDKKPDMEVVAQATSVEEALELSERIDFNIALVSAILPQHSGLELTRTLNRTKPDVKVLAIGLPDSKSVILQYVMAGASGYVLQDVSVDRLFDNVRAASEDRAYVSPSIAAAFMDQISELVNISAAPYLEPSAYEELTPREMQVLELIDQGYTNRDIAGELFIEVGTVKNHVHNILKKLDVRSRQDAAAHLPFLQQDDESSAS